jgi:hypothetical protein
MGRVDWKTFYLAFGEKLSTVEHVIGEQRVNGEEIFSLIFSHQRYGAPGESRTPDPLLRSYAI